MEEKEYKYLVGVECMTFNQSKYILDALNGFMMQQTNFPFVVMVVDDASTDGEQEVIRQFVSEQFDLADTNISYEKETDYAYITYAQHKTNKNCYIVAMYLKENYYRQRKPKYPHLSEWRDNVKYIALCEGDDYWIDAQKLQKQVDFLESNPKCTFCYTRANILYQESQIIPRVGGNPYVDYEHMILSNPVMTLTTLIRNDLLNQYYVDINPAQYNWKLGDLPLWLYLSAHGIPGYLKDVTATYRFSVGSASHSGDICNMIAFNTSVFEVKKLFNELYNEKSQTILNAITIEYYNRNIQAAISMNDFKCYVSNVSHLNDTSLLRKTYWYFVLLRLREKWRSSYLRETLVRNVKRIFGKI